MKKLFSFLIALTILFVPSLAHAADIEATYWNMDAVLEDNGDLRITENYEYRFEDSFNGVFRSVSIKGSDGLEDIQVYQVVNGELMPFRQSQDARNGDSDVFSVTREGDLNVIKIFTPTKRGETKIFQIAYTNKNVAIRQGDTGEVHYSFLSDGSDVPIDAMTITLTLPGSPTEGVRSYLKASAADRDVGYEEGKVSAHLTKVPAESEVTLRVLLPLSAIPNSSRLGNQRFDDIAAKEDALLQKEIDHANSVTTLTSVSFILSAIAILLILFGVLSTRSRPGDPMEFGDPLALTPGEVTYLMDKSSSIDRTFNATLFDFVRRGVLRVENEGTQQRSDIVFYRSDASRALLTDFENRIYDFFMNRIGNGSKFKMMNIGTYIDKETGYEDLNQTTTKVKQALASSLEDAGYYKNSSLVIGLIVILIIMALLSVGLTIYGVIASIFTVVVAGIGAVILAIIPKLSSKGVTHQKYFSDLKKSLTANDDVSIDPELALVYSIALGLDGGSLEDYSPAPEEGGYLRGDGQYAYGGGYIPPWFFYYMMFNRDNRYSHSYRSNFMDTTSDSGGGFGGGGFSGSSGGGGGGGF